MKYLKFVNYALLMSAAGFGAFAAFVINKYPEKVSIFLPDVPIFYWLLGLGLLGSGIATLWDYIKSDTLASVLSNNSGKIRVFVIACAMTYIVIMISLTAMSFFIGGILQLEDQESVAVNRKKYASISLTPEPEVLLARGRSVYVPRGNLYDLRASYPSAMYINEDRQVEVFQVIFSSHLMKMLYPEPSSPKPESLDRFGHFGVPESPHENPEVVVGLSSNSFSIDPMEPVRIPLMSQGPRVRFLITPREIGLRRLQLTSQLAPATAQLLGLESDVKYSTSILNIEVLPENVWLGLSMQQIKILNLIATSIGLPGAAVLIMGMLLAFLKEQGPALKVMVPARRKKRRRGKK